MSFISRTFDRIIIAREMEARRQIEAFAYSTDRFLSEEDVASDLSKS